MVTGNYFDVLGVRAAARPARSPFTAAEDEQLGAHPVVVLSDGLWRRRFGASPAIVGSTIELNRQRFTVLGIAPPRFRGVNALGGPALWLPISAHKQVTHRIRGRELRQPARPAHERRGPPEARGARCGRPTPP